MKKLKKARTNKLIVPLVVIAISIALYLGYMYVWEYHRHRWMSLEEICNITDSNSDWNCGTQECKKGCSSKYCFLRGGFEVVSVAQCIPKSCSSFNIHECPAISCEIKKNSNTEKSECTKRGEVEK